MRKMSRQNFCIALQMLCPFNFNTYILRRSGSETAAICSSFADGQRTIALKTVPKFNNVPQSQKFHYDEAERMLLSTLVAGFVGKRRQQGQFRILQGFQKPFKFAVTDLETMKQGKRILDFFFNRVTIVQVVVTSFRL